MGAEIGNKYAQKWTKDEAYPLFIKGLKYAQKSTLCLHLADAINQTGIPYSTYDYLAEKHKVLGTIKKDTKIEVLRRVNKGTMEGDYTPAAGIWRMKQLGETDRVDQNITHRGGDEIKISIVDGSKK